MVSRTWWSLWWCLYRSSWRSWSECTTSTGTTILRCDATSRSLTTISVLEPRKASASKQYKFLCFILEWKLEVSKYVRLFLNGAIGPISIQTKMSLATAGIYCMISPPLSGVMEECFIVLVQQLQMFYHQRCCMSASQRMFGSLWNVVVAREHRRQDGSRRPGTTATLSLEKQWWLVGLYCEEIWCEHTHIYIF